MAGRLSDFVPILFSGRPIRPWPSITRKSPPLRRARRAAYATTLREASKRRVSGPSRPHQSATRTGQGDYRTIGHPQGASAPGRTNPEFNKRATGIDGTSADFQLRAMLTRWITLRSASQNRAPRPRSSCEHSSELPMYRDYRTRDRLLVFPASPMRQRRGY